MVALTEIFSAQTEAEFAAFPAFPLPAEAPECPGLSRSPIWSSDQNYLSCMTHLALRSTVRMENSWSFSYPCVQLRCSLSSWTHPPGVTGSSCHFCHPPLARSSYKLFCLVVAPVMLCSKVRVQLHTRSIQKSWQRRHHGACSMLPCSSMKPSRTLCHCALPSLWDFSSSVAFLI